MITEEPNFDLSILQDNFTTCEDYTKEVILEELESWQKHKDFLCLVSRNGGIIDGFLIGYRNRNSLWLAQVWRKTGTDLQTSRKSFELAKEWAMKRNMISITGETDRKQMRAMEKYGFKEDSVTMKVIL